MSMRMLRAARIAGLAVAVLGVATLSVQLRKRGYTDVFLEGVHPNRAGARVVGRAPPSGSSRSVPTCSPGRAAATTPRRWRSTPSARARCS